MNLLPAAVYASRVMYEWAIAKRDTWSKTIMKVGSGVMHNTINIIGSSIDVAKEAHFANRYAGEKRKNREYGEKRE